jgi:hypothetical protein
MKNILFVIFFALTFVSCDKDEPEAEGTAMELLAGTGEKKWKLSTAIASVDGATVDLAQNYPCWADNILTLKANGTYTLEDSGLPCNQGAVISSNWTYTENPKQVKLGELQVANRVFKDLVLDINELKSTQFSGVTKNITTNVPPFGEITAQTVTLTFVEVK